MPRTAWTCRVIAAVQMVIAVETIILTSSSQENIVGLVVGSAFLALPGAMLLVTAGVALTTRRTSVRQLRMRVRRRKPEPSIGVSFDVTCGGNFSSDQVIVNAVVSERPHNAAVESLIDETWRKAVETARTFGQILRDGNVGRLAEYRVVGSRLELDLGVTRYREFIGTNLYNASLVSQMGAGLLADALGTSAIAITADGRIVLGRRSDRVSFHQGHLHTFGGLLDDCDRRGDGRYDVWAAIRREIREELGIGDDCVHELACVGLVRDRSIMQPEILFDAHVSVSSTELGRRFSLTNDEEHTRLEACDDLPESIVPFIQRSEPMTPVAKAALLLHGRQTWGADWYEGACYVLFGEMPQRPDQAGGAVHAS